MKIDKRRNLFLFFTALLFSAFGYEFIFFIMTLHLYDLNRNPLNIGIFTAITFVPRLFSSFMGGLADRFGKGKCFAISSFMVSVLLLLMSYTTGINEVYVIWFGAATFLTFIVNVRSSLMPEIVYTEKLAISNALTLSLINSAKLLGPLLGGFVAMVYQIRPLIFFTCGIYLLAAISALFVKTPLLMGKEKPSFLENAKRGFRFMAENPIFKLLTSVAFLWRLFLGLQLSVFVIYIKTSLLGTSEQYGLFITVMGLGSIFGSLLGPYAAKKIEPAKLMKIGLSLHYLSFVLLGLSKVYALSLGIIFFSYLAFYMTLVGMHAVRDQITEFDIRSSAYGTVTAILTPPAIVSMLVGSYLSSLFSVTEVLVGAGALAFISLHVVFGFARNSIRSFHEEKRTA